MSESDIDIDELETDDMSSSMGVVEVKGLAISCLTSEITADGTELKFNVLEVGIECAIVS